MSGLIDIAQNICDNINSKVQAQNGKGKIFYKPITYKDSIIKIYSTFEGPKDFLRIPTGDKIDAILSNENCVFLGAYLDGRLAGISCLKEIPENYPFFRAPECEGGTGKVFTFGGLYVRPECEGFGSATGMVRILTQSAKTYIETLRQSGKQEGLHQGIFFEADYRNVGSLAVLSRHGNYLGFYVDEKKLEGPTIMLYDSFTSTPIPISIPTLHVPEDKNQGIINLTKFTTEIAEQVGGMKRYIIPFDDQENHMVVLNNIPQTAGLGREMFEFEDKYTTQFVNYAPGEAREIMTGSKEQAETGTIIELPPKQALEEMKEQSTLEVPAEKIIEGMSAADCSSDRVRGFTIATLPRMSGVGSSLLRFDDRNYDMNQ